MKKTLIWIGSVIGAAAVMALVYTHLMHAADTNHVIATTGECLTSAPKDRTSITLHVKTLDDNAAVSMRIAKVKIAEITEFLKTIDVKMQTTMFDSREKTEWNHVEQKSIRLGYETSIAIDVSAEKPETIEIVLNQFAGNKDIYLENFRMFTSAEAMKPVLEKCLGDAVANARVRATAIAVGDKRKVGKLVSAEYSLGDSVGARSKNFLVRGMMEYNSAMEDLDIGTELVSKDTLVSVTVYATFEVK